MALWPDPILFSVMESVLQSRRRDGSSKERTRSLGVSLGLHVIALLVLGCVVSYEFELATIKLTVETTSDLDDQASSFTAMPDLFDEPSFESETLADVDTLQIPQLLTSVNHTDVRDSIEQSQKSVQFFGSRAYGNRFVYILDVSTSMSARSHGRIQRAKDELIRSVSRLSPQQSYYVFLFCYETCHMFGHPSRFAYKKSVAKDRPELSFVSATPENLSRLKQWVYRVRLAGGTDPRNALLQAHSMKPDAVFLLSDGQFNRPSRPIPGEGWSDSDQIPEAFTVLAGVERALSDVVVHTIAFENPFTRSTMEQLAEITGGSSRYVRTASLLPIKEASLINGLREIKRRGKTAALRQSPVRLRYAQELIEDGELAFAEYLLRPIRRDDLEDPDQQALLEQIDAILVEELGETRLEDFKGISLNEIERKTRLNRSFNRYPN